MIRLQMPKVYRVDTIIEPGIIGIDDRGNFIYVDSPDNIGRKITHSAYNQRIIQLLNIDPTSATLAFKADSDKKGGSQVVWISSEWEEKERALGMNVSGKLISLLNEDYQSIVDQRKHNYDSMIAVNQNKISEIQIQQKDLGKQIQIKSGDLQGKINELRLKREQLERGKQQIENLHAELKTVRENSDRMAQERDELFNKGDKKDDLSLLLHTTTLQQNIAYFNELNTQIFELRKEGNEIETDITKLETAVSNLTAEVERLKLQKEEGMKSKIDDINSETERLKSEKSIIANIKVIQEPEISIEPVKPRKIQIVGLSAAGAFFVLVILAFFIEYVRNAAAAPRK
jgi:hypothetical protein